MGTFYIIFMFPRVKHHSSSKSKLYNICVAHNATRKSTLLKWWKVIIIPYSRCQDFPKVIFWYNYFKRNLYNKMLNYTDMEKAKMCFKSNHFAILFCKFRCFNNYYFCRCPLTFEHEDGGVGPVWPGGPLAAGLSVPMEWRSVYHTFISKFGKNMEWNSFLWQFFTHGMKVSLLALAQPWNEA